METAHMMINHCAVCGSHEHQKVDNIKYWDILLGEYEQHVVQCCRCGFVYAQNPYADETLQQWYKDESQYSDEFYFKQQNVSQRNKTRWCRQKEFIAGTISLKPGFRVAEVGAGTGYNLSLWSECADTFAIEPSSRSCQAIKGKYGIDYFNGTFQAYMQGGGHCEFDLVICAHVMEHIAELGEFVELLRKCTKRYLYIEVPSINLSQADGARGIFLNEHINYFTQESLCRLMERHGFRLIGLDNDVKKEWLWGEPLITLWEKREQRDSAGGEDLPSEQKDIWEYLAVDNAKRELLTKRFSCIDRSAKVGLYNVGNNVCKKLFAWYSFQDLNITAVYDDNEALKGKELFGQKIIPFDVDDFSGEEVEKIVICNSNYQKFIVEDFKRWGLGDRVITLF